MQMRCPLLKCGGTKDATVCVYMCKTGTKSRCPEYSRKYQELLKFQPEEKITEKYGAPELVLPLSLRKKRKRRVGEAN